MSETDADQDRELLRALIRGKRPVDFEAAGDLAHEDGSTHVNDEHDSEDKDVAEEEDFEEVEKFWNPHRGREMYATPFDLPISPQMQDSIRFRCTLCPDKGPFETMDDAERFMVSKFYVKKLVQIIGSAKRSLRHRKRAGGAESSGAEASSLESRCDSLVGDHTREQSVRDMKEQKNDTHMSEDCSASGKPQLNCPGYCTRMLSNDTKHRGATTKKKKRKQKSANLSEEQIQKRKARFQFKKQRRLERKAQC